MTDKKQKIFFTWGLFIVLIFRRLRKWTQMIFSETWRWLFCTRMLFLNTNKSNLTNFPSLIPNWGRKLRTFYWKVTEFLNDDKILCLQRLGVYVRIGLYRRAEQTVYLYVWIGYLCNYKYSQALMWCCLYPQTVIRMFNPKTIIRACLCLGFLQGVFCPFLIRNISRTCES